MTDEELRVRAIQELEFYKKDDTFMLADITVDLAIKALEQMPVTTTAGEGGVIYYPQVEGVTPTVVDAGKQDPCEDAISRQSATILANDLKQDLPDDAHLADMVMAHNEGVLEYQTQLSLLPSVNQEPCEDAISRKAILEEFESDQYHLEFCKEHHIERSISMEMVRIRLHDLPLVNPQPKTGYWIKRPNGFKCSKCLIVHSHTSIFCPSCGAKMVEPQESEEQT